jgi:hypothetical protein
MKKKQIKKIKFKIFVPIFGYTVIITNDVKTYNTIVGKYDKKENYLYEGQVFDCHPVPQSIVYLKNIKDGGLAIHEFCHVVQNLCDTLGVKDRETFAYLMQEIVDKYLGLLEKLST